MRKTVPPTFRPHLPFVSSQALDMRSRPEPLSCPGLSPEDRHVFCLGPVIVLFRVPPSSRGENIREAVPALMKHNASRRQKRLREGNCLGSLHTAETQDSHSSLQSPLPMS